MRCRLFFAVLAAMLLCGCSEREVNKAFIHPGRDFIAGCESAFCWSGGDEITLFDGSTLNSEYRYNGAPAENQGLFSLVGTASGSGTELTANYAVYPYDQSAKVFQSGVIETTLPQVQMCDGVSVDKKACVMVAVTKDRMDTFLNFKNIGGFLKLQMYGDEVTVKEVVLSGYNNEKLSGMIGVMTSHTSDPIVGMGGTAAATVALDCGKGVKLGASAEKATPFWIVLPPVTFEKGFEVSVIDVAGDTLVESFSDKVVIERNSVVSVDPFEVEMELKGVPYVTFSAAAQQTLTMSKAVAALEYSVNGGKWAELGTNTVTFGGDAGNLRLRGTNPFGTTGEVPNPETEPKIKFGNSEKVNCEGDIRTLVDYKNYSTADCSKARFMTLFAECRQLLTAPSLPSKTLADGCYYLMFVNCSSLTQAPELPATELAVMCYARMFWGCTSLEQAPDLLAEVDAGNSYNHMFYNCSALKYLKIMLVDAPPAGGMDVLKSISVSGLTIVVNRAATWVNQYNIPSDWIIKYAGESVWTNDNTPYLTFSSDSRQTLSLDIKVSPFEQDRDHYTTIEYSVDGSVWQDLYNRVITFGGVTGDLKLRSKNPNGTVKVDVRTDGTSPDYFYTGFGFGDIDTYILMETTIKFGTEAKVSCTGDIRTLVDYANYNTADCSNARFSSLFKDAAVLTSAPSLPIKTVASYCYESMFYKCTSLTSAPALPATTLALCCYETMFGKCSSLVSAPELPALVLLPNCYYAMFYYCNNLSYIKMMATDVSAEYCLGAWTEGTASSGTFVKNASATWDESKIVPKGWTITTATN